MLESPDATGICRLHVVCETAVPGVRDAVGWHLALREMPGRQTRIDENRIALRRLDLAAPQLTPSSLRQRAGDGVGRSAALGNVLIHAPLSTTSVLDEATDIVSMVASPWAAVVIATSIPYRFLQALFIDRLIEVGADATRYGTLLGTTANLAIAAFVLALWGRAVFARACRLAASRGEPPQGEAWRVKPVALASYIFTGTLAELVFYATLFSAGTGTILAAILGGLAIGTMELNERASVLGAIRLIARYGRETRIVTALVMVFACAMVVAFINVMATFSFGMWLADVFLSADLSRWGALFSGNNRRFVLAAIAGAWIAIEPFWIAANVVLVRKAGAAETGEDLRVWFEEVRGS
jgi:hypothetical protein